jgi:hypothetical protein
MSGSILRPVNTTRFLSRVIGSVLLLTVSGIAYLQAQVVRGQVVDSITLVPIDGGTVTLISADGSEVGRTRTNPEGLFLIQAGAVGQFHLRAEAEGYRLSEFPPFQLATDQLATYMLLVPSIEPQPSVGLTPMFDDWDPDAVAAQVCPEDTPANLPVVLGLVRDAMTQEPVVDAEIRISWPAVSGMLRERVDLDDTEGWAISGDGGLYGICGLPVDSRIAAYAVEGNRISEVVSLTFEWGGVFSGVYTGGGFKEMPGRAWRQDFELRPVTMRTAAIIGTVMDSGGTSISNAVVSIAGTPFSTRTNVTGAFRLAGLPPGDMRVFAQRLGYEPVRFDVQLNEGETISLPPFQLGGAPTVLDPVAVEAEVSEARRSLPEFERRRETTSGYFVTREEFEQQGVVDEVIDILRRAPGMYIRRGTSALEWIITTRRGSMRGGLRDFDTNPCYPLVFVDRSYVGTTGTVDVNREISAYAIEAVEVYSSAVAVPQEFNRVGAVCGVIVFWTR